MTDPDTEHTRWLAAQSRVAKLPKWAQEHIRDLENRVKSAEAPLPWTKPGMSWTTLFHPDHSQRREKDIRLFILHENSAHPICDVGPNDFVFVGRGKHHD